MRFISVNFFDMGKFTKLYDDNDYLNKVIEEVDGRFTVLTDDTKEIERLLNKNNIRFKIKQV